MTGQNRKTPSYHYSRSALHCSPARRPAPSTGPRAPGRRVRAAAPGRRPGRRRASAGPAPAGAWPRPCFPIRNATRPSHHARRLIPFIPVSVSICGPRQLGPTPVLVRDYHPSCQFSVNSCGIHTYYSRIIPPHAEPAQSSTQARAQGTATRRIAVIRRACFEEGSRTEPVGLPGCLAAGARSASGPGSTLPPGSPIRQGVEHPAQGSEVCHRSTGTHAVRGREPGRVDRHPGLVTG